MIAAATLALFVAAILALVRAFRGPALYDRVLAVNVFGTKTVLIISILGFLMGRPEFMDIAILYALINFIAIVAILKYFRYRSFQVGLTRAPKTVERAGGDQA